MATALENTDKGVSSVLGVIHPPSDLKTLIDSTAKYVARVGSEFEQRIRKEKSHLTFLNEGDAYHSYYQLKVKDFRENGDEPKNKTNENKTMEQQKKITKEPIELPTPILPPPEYSFLITVPSIAAIDISIVKLTAQSVARNGRQFLMSLMQRESRNYLFDFLRPHHILFGYFTKLVEQYTKVILPSENLITTLKEQEKDKTTVLKQVNHRVSWELQQQKKKKEIQDKIDENKRQYLLIDWHDFIIAETVDFPEDDLTELPPFVKKSLLKQRILMQERYEREMKKTPQSDNMNDSEMPKQLSVEEKIRIVSSITNEVEVKPSKPNEVTQLQQTDNIRIIDYDPKVENKTTSTGKDFTICPNCKQTIALSQMAEHLRVELLDPRWRESDEKRKQEIQEQKKTFASGIDMQSNLERLAKVRTDIFEGEELQVEESKNDKSKIVWNANPTSMTSSTNSSQTFRNEEKNKIFTQNFINETEKNPQGTSSISPTTSFIQSHIQTSQSIAPPGIHPSIPSAMNIPTLSGSSFLPPGIQSPSHRPIGFPYPMNPNVIPGMLRMPPMYPGMPQGMPFMHPMGMMDYSKRAKLDNNSDILVNFTIAVPSVKDKPEWNLNGQMISASVGLNQNIADLKNVIEATLKMPAAKQKLQIGPMFLKDSETIASFNMMPGTVIQLSIKERGGRKK